MQESRIKFLEKTHQYLTEDGKELTSVSAFTKKFEGKVDWQEVARKYAVKQTKNGNPMTKKEVLEMWENKRNKTSEIGTLYHNIREQETLSQEKPIFYNVPCEKKQCDMVGDDKYSIPINHLENNTVYTELMIYDLEHMICGQADKVIVTNNKIHVWDYKTDKEISFYAYSSQWVDPRKMQPPLSHLDDVNGNHYSIKMSLYMYMLWRANNGRLKTGDLHIEHIHLKRDEDGIPILQDGKPVVLKVEDITLPFRKREVEAMLKTLNVKK